MKIITTNATPVLADPGGWRVCTLRELEVREVIREIPAGWLKIDEGWIHIDQVKVISSGAQKVEVNAKAKGPAFPCYVCTMKAMGTDTPRCFRYKECHLWLNWAKKTGVISEVNPQTPDQAESAAAPQPFTQSEILQKYLYREYANLWRRDECDEECTIEVYIPATGNVVVRFQDLMGNGVWSEYCTLVTFESYLKAIIEKEGLKPLE